MAEMYEHSSHCDRGGESKPAQDPKALNQPLRFRGILALAEEDDVASRLRDEELKNAAKQIRAISAASSTAHA
jgi:hypothetical protein